MAFEVKFTPQGGIIAREIQVRNTTCDECQTDNLHFAGTEAQQCVNMLCPSNVELNEGPS